MSLFNDYMNRLIQIVSTIFFFFFFFVFGVFRASKII